MPSDRWQPPLPESSPVPARGGGPRRRAAAGAAVALCLALGSSAPAAAPAAARGGGPEAAAHEATLAGLNTQAARIRARLDGLYERADEKILDYAEAAARLEAAEEESVSAGLTAERARGRTRELREDAADYAAAAYMGADLSAALAWSSADGPQEVLDRGADLALVGQRRGSAVETAGAALSAAETLGDRAEEAEEERREAAGEAADARDEALEAVAEQEGALADVTAEQSRVELALQRVRGDTGEQEQEREQALEQAQAAAGAQGGPGGLSGGARARDGTAGAADPAGQGCTASGAEGFANGRIPASALCPLPQRGEMLRAGAAAAFIELDGAFRDRFDRPMCVTDAYRPFSDQVRLFREKAAGMAASPGTSAHGRGTAVDLCGGIDRLGSPEHEWMAAHAPAFGWRNPPWARGGFEPWHWEYTA
ncbi:M15 family metallopeptidase [Streptomonospora wellingtoniae]|uniref:M15 family metallopeptidase n=1 Tax=Streptomonospora wellingtoniae TaxID=3075544 RepID=A0ABU2KVK8_9ACTN|nr:M15 family metallopeptidase [Streptomonospora sp. DSM 45055]MDT0303329.1 M15 family metallopeptidase [Streptomonospora sp. DSM 45055]